ncbi:MAG: aspartate carbamoyltransferase catalytic subunit [Ruminococcaceae bacterium]|nr:aspartate carbamoyltransferase catalytic subunit [Oscillospiraceae bacterium]
MKSLLTLKDLSTDEIFSILDQAEKFRGGEKCNCGEGKIVANLFFEPSTRTHYSFEAAELRLGLSTMDFLPEASSMKKGETFYDTVKTFESLGVDALVIRHSVNEFYNEIKNVIPPILNAGDGTGNHPTQSLLDLLTIREEFGKFEGLNIAIIGDVKHSRVAHTNFEVFKRLGMNTFYSCPDDFSEDIAHAHPITIDEAAKEMDVVMLLRVQHERHGKGMVMTDAEYNTRYGMNRARLDMMKKNAIIMHPAPFNRGCELTDEVVECDRSRIFKQMANGVFVRMAVLKRAFED